MGKAKIELRGIPEKEPKIINDIGTVELIFKIDVSSTIPKEFKDIGESFYVVHVSSKVWRWVAKRATKDSEYIIHGDLKARVSKKGMPLINVICQQINLINSPKVEVIENEKNNDEEKIFKPWYKDIPEDQLVDINTNDITITDKVHLNSQTININGLYKASTTRSVIAPIAVRKIENGEYSLVIGMKQLMQAKLLNIKTIKAFVTELGHDQFVKEYGIIENIKK